MRKKVIAGNWKMNTALQEGMNLFDEINKEVGRLPEKLLQQVNIIVCPPFIHLKKCNELRDGQIALGAQNVYWEEKGAYTGEISPIMLKGVVDYVIIGHSERRQYFGETNETVNKKIKSSLQHELKPIICVGESEDMRNQGNYIEYVQGQIEKAIEGLSSQELQQCIIAYEPIWAIGTGNTASNEQAEEVIAAIRAFFASKVSDAISDQMPLLYGGSANHDNCEGLLAKDNIDGFLIGGASLVSWKFVKMVEIAGKIEEE